MNFSTMDDSLMSPKPGGYGAALANVNAVNVEAGSEDESQPMSKKQKLIKAGLLIALVLVIVYVILDYTVSEGVA